VNQADHVAEKGAKGFSCWTQFVAMLFCHLGRADTLREICLNLNPGAIVAFDRAYNDYQLFAKCTSEGVYFVTRMKSNADYEIVERRDQNPERPDFNLSRPKTLRKSRGPNR
ncbi:DUF4372 domain-containing protein, partial [bacterium]|nr:DUF4372 domain-containing protein [bacterium]